MRSSSLRLAGICAAAGFGLLFTVRDAEARSSGQTNSEERCRQAAKADAVFEATVEAVEPSAAGPGLRSRTDHVTVRLRDIRPVRGEAGTTVMTTRPGMPCGSAFRVGTRYLISANRSQDDDQLYLSCGLIRPSDGAAGLVRYLESLSSPDSGGRIWGRVVMPSASRRATPMASMRVTISGPREAEAETDAAGEFEFVALPQGSYRVSVAVPPNRPELLSFGRQTIHLEGAYACGEILLWPQIQSRVEGRIVDQTGAPIPGVNVTLESTYFGSTSTTDDHGHYDFAGLFEGRYTVQVRAQPDRNGLAPLTPAGVETQVTRQVDLALGGHALLEPIRLHRLTRISLTGRVVDRNGEGLGGVPLWVIAIDYRSRWSRRLVTGEDGGFSVPAYIGRRQQIIVGNREQPRAEVTIVAGSGPVVITIP